MTQQNRPGQNPGPSQANTSQSQGNRPQSQGSAKVSVEQKANQATQRVADKAQSSFENAKSSVTKQLSAAAQAINSAADQLERQDHGRLSQRMKQLVDKAENASQYLKDKSPKELKQDAEQFARNKPAWFLGGAFLAGVLSARFLKSSEKDDSEKGSVEYARA
jgi:ABC-type transporter Mla subunit MlaD